MLGRFWMRSSLQQSARLSVRARPRRTYSTELPQPSPISTPTQIPPLKPNSEPKKEEDYMGVHITLAALALGGVGYLFYDTHQSEKASEQDRQASKQSQKTRDQEYEQCLRNVEQAHVQALSDARDHAFSQDILELQQHCQKHHPGFFPGQWRINEIRTKSDLLDSLAAAEKGGIMKPSSTSDDPKERLAAKLSDEETRQGFKQAWKTMREDEKERLKKFMEEEGGFWGVPWQKDLKNPFNRFYWED
ncbi:MAG: hypothetical protein Q9220_007309 [cf. Caloplaca sp. 1 TL-2023]